LLHPFLATKRLAAVLIIGLATGLIVGCRGNVNGANGDAPIKPIVDKYGGGTHISSKLQNLDGTFGFYGPAHWIVGQESNPNSDNCPYPNKHTEYVTGVTVTAVDRFDETCNGGIGTVYVQDTVGLDDASKIPIFAAISMYNPTYSPPDLRVLPGNVLDLNGNYEEFAGPSTSIFQFCQTLPQVAGSALFRFDGNVPPPVQITADDLSTFAGARQYLSMLVTVNNVVIQANGATKSGRYNADVTVTNGSAWQISDELFPIGDLYPLFAADQFESITGIVTYFYSYHVAPRSLEDITLKGGGHPSLPDGGIPDHCSRVKPVVDAGAGGGGTGGGGTGGSGTGGGMSDGGTGDGGDGGMGDGGDGGDGG
jgi:hypothetical protein